YGQSQQPYGQAQQYGQQPYGQQQYGQQQAVAPMGVVGGIGGSFAGRELGGLIGGDTGEAIGGFIGGALGGLLSPFQAQQAHQTAATNPGAFWTQVARLGMQYGLPAVRAILDQVIAQGTPQQAAPQPQPQPAGATS
ncbi:MAG: hypothetical protein HOY71_29910, partial [Nonomuraea sp.]|nr:hypothetical protein [Nonomuraea sp.]